MLQSLYDKANKEKDACMKFYDVSKSLYLGTYTYGIGLGAGLLQVRDSMNCR